MDLPGVHHQPGKAEQDHGGQENIEVIGAAINNKGVNQDKDHPRFRGAEPVIINLKFIGCPEGEKGVDHKPSQNNNQGEIPDCESLRCDHIADKDQGAEKDIIEKMIHVKAPFNQARIPLPADFTIKKVGDILENDHEGNQPEEVVILSYIETDYDINQAPQQGGHGEVIGLYGRWDFWHCPMLEPVFRHGEDGAADFFITAKSSLIFFHSPSSLCCNQALSAL